MIEFMHELYGMCLPKTAATTATVVLDSPAKSKTWYAEVQSMAELKGFGNMSSPTLPDVPALPVVTAQPLASDIKANAGSVGGLSADEREIHQLKLQVCRGILYTL